jgi:hypothetical protein
VEIARLVLDYLKVLVWPLATLVLVHRFRGQIEELVKRVRTLSAPGFDAAFSEEVAGVSAEAQAALRWAVPVEPAWSDRPWATVPAPGDQGWEHPQPDREPTPVPVPGPMPYGSPPDGQDARRPADPASGPLMGYPPADDSLARMAYTQPQGAVMVAWSDVEARLRAMSRDRFGGTRAETMTADQLAGELGLPDGIKTAIADLRGVRDRAAHRPDDALSPTAAAAYVDTCRALSRYISGQGTP